MTPTITIDDLADLIVTAFELHESSYIKGTYRYALERSEAVCTVLESRGLASVPGLEYLITVILYGELVDWAYEHRKRTLAKEVA